MAKNTNFKISKTKTDEKNRKNRIRRLKQEISRKASMANKRIKRLEKNDLVDVPAYRAYADGGRVKFSVKGKSYNELQAELARVNSFLDSKTSTVRGANRVAKQIANTANIKYSNLKQLYSNVNNFFRLASQVEQYMKSANQSAFAINYQRIWQAINQYMENENKLLLESVDDMGKALPIIAKLTGDLYFEHAIDGFDDVLNL